MNKEALIKTLLDLDEEASLVLDSPVVRPRMIIVGGSAFMLRDLTSRAVTHDIDVLSSDRILKKILSHYPNINHAVEAYIDQIPYQFEDRLVKMPLKTTCIDFFTPSLEDLVVMKLYGWRPHDIIDLTSPYVIERIDWELLDHLVYSRDEAAASCLVERRYQEMAALYEDYRKEHAR